MSIHIYVYIYTHTYIYIYVCMYMYHNHIQVPQDQSKSRICVSKLCPLRPQEKVPVPIEQLGKQAQMSSNVCSTQCSIITLLHVTECECRNDCRLEISGTLAVFEQKSGDQVTLLTFNMTVFCATHHAAMSAWHWIRMTVFCVVNCKVCCSKLAILRRDCKASVVNLWSNLVSSCGLLTVPND